MKKSDKDHLTWYIRELLHLEKDIVIISDNGLIHLEVKGRDFYLYIKSLTYAGNPYPLNTTRAQLPKRDEFNGIKESDEIFLFLGYDEINEVFACWDPLRTKKRLNEKQYVSFFSRLNLQESVKPGEFIPASLQNDYKYVIFRLNDLSTFLLNIEKFFPDLITNSPIISISEESQGILTSVENDKSVQLFIDESSNQDENISTLKLISGCYNEFGEYYYRMKLKDWSNIINIYLLKKESVSNNEIIYEDIASSDNSIVAEPLLFPEVEDTNLSLKDISVGKNLYFEHILDWSTFEYGFTIDKKYHQIVFELIGQYIARGTGINIKVRYNDELFDAKITNANSIGRKGDTIRLLYSGSSHNLGYQLKSNETIIYNYIKQFKDQYGGRKQYVIPDNLRKKLVFVKGNGDNIFDMEVVIGDARGDESNGIVLSL